MTHPQACGHHCQQRIQCLGFRVLLGCKLGSQCSQGATCTRLAAGTHWAARAQRDPTRSLSLPLMDMAASTGCALPPDSLAGAKRHIRGCQAAVLAGVPLLHQLWHAGQRWLAGSDRRESLSLARCTAASQRVLRSVLGAKAGQYIYLLTSKCVPGH